MPKLSQLERVRTTVAWVQGPSLITEDICIDDHWLKDCLCRSRQPYSCFSASHTSFIRKTRACIPHLEMILFSFSMKTKTTTTKTRKRAYLLLILRLCRKSRHSWGKASPFSMGKGGAVGTQLGDITQDLAGCLQVGDTLSCGEMGSQDILVCRWEQRGAFPPDLWGSWSSLAARIPYPLP